LNHTEVNDVGLQFLGGLKQLESLWLDETAVTDAGVRSLIGLKQLRDLGLRQTRVTSQGAAFLRRELPQTKIHWEKP
jgi:hypothetical protein